MWYQIDVCANQYMCSIYYYLMSFLSKLCQFFLDRAVDIPGHVKDVVARFNYVHKRYLATCLIMRSTTEVDNIDSKRMNVDAITNKGEVRFVT